MDCANKKMSSTNTPRNISELPKLTEGLKWIGKITKPSPNKCLPACDFQKNDYRMSFVLNPQKKNFFYQKKFCHVAAHILEKTCKIEKRKYFLNKTLPNLCDRLTSFNEYFGNISSCKKWPTNFLEGEYLLR